MPSEDEEDRRPWGAVIAACIVAVLIGGYYLWPRSRKGQVEDRTLPREAVKEGDGAAAPSLNGFMGHYGYLLSVPSSYQVHPKFSGTLEVVQFVPQSCRSLTREQCVEAGLFSLLVIPKNRLFEENQIQSLSEYVEGIVNLSETDGERPSRPVRANIAGLKSWTFSREAPKRGPFTTTTYLEGAKVSYVFAYNEENANVEMIMRSLSEISPHDNAPKP